MNDNVAAKAGAVNHTHVLAVSDCYWAKGETETQAIAELLELDEGAIRSGIILYRCGPTARLSDWGSFAWMPEESEPVKMRRLPKTFRPTPAIRQARKVIRARKDREADAKWEAIGKEFPADTLPEPVETDVRISFSIAWFATEAEADRYGAYVRATGATYNGGWYHGRPCGREPSRDVERDGKKLYAVTR